MVILKKEAITELSNKLFLPINGSEQDWDVEMADSNRIDEFIDFYKNNKLSTDEKLAMMSLILASYDDLLNDNDLLVDSRWDKIRSILEMDKIYFIDLINYWSLINVVDDDLFKITPLIRKIK
ncbi:hypothetical protein [Sphingobacterium multivorum]|uniref:hypothetical protein n=1 Tax=Sphingobacterium multivorum TaxID=28454 RepID=UPI00345E589E